MNETTNPFPSFADTPTRCPLMEIKVIYKEIRLKETREKRQCQHIIV